MSERDREDALEQLSAALAATIGVDPEDVATVYEPEAGRVLNTEEAAPTGGNVKYTITLKDSSAEDVLGSLESGWTEELAVQDLAISEAEPPSTMSGGCVQPPQPIPF